MMYSQANIQPFSTQTIQELDPFRSVYQLQSGNAYPWYGAKAYTPRSPSATSFGKKKNSRKRKGSGTSKKKKAVAYCIRKNRVVKVYKKTGKTGRYYYDGKKVKKGQKCYKLKSKANAALKNKRPKRRKSSSSSNTKYYYVINGTKKKQPSWKKGYNKDGRPSCSKYDKELTCTPAKAGCKWTSSGCVNKFGSSFGAPYGRPVSPASGYNYTMSQYADNVSTPTNHLLGKITGTSAYSYPTNRPNYHFYDQNINNSGYGF